MDKEEIITLVLELYSSKPEAKEYLDFFVAPNETEVLNKYKQIIAYEFYPGGRKDAQVRFSVCCKALSDFKKLKPSGAAIVELMVFYMENACELLMTTVICESSFMTLWRRILRKRCRKLLPMICGKIMMRVSNNV